METETRAKKRAPPPDILIFFEKIFFFWLTRRNLPGRKVIALRSLSSLPRKKKVLRIKKTLSSHTAWKQKPDHA